MKKVMQRAMLLVVYVFILLWVTGFAWSRIWDMKSCAMVVLGMFLLSVPQLFQEIKQKNKKEESKEKLFLLVCRQLSGNALLAAYMTTAMMLFASFSGEVQPDDIAQEIALNCRPVFYGILLYVLFQGMEKEEKAKNEVLQNEVFPKETTPVDSKEEDSLQESPRLILTEQVCYFFRSQGLTAREAEVAKFLYLDYSNKEIAGELFISETTVKKHVTHILEKLGISQRGQIAEIVGKWLPK